MASGRHTLICTVGTSVISNVQKSQSTALHEDLTQRNAPGLSLRLLDHDPFDRLMGAEINSISGLLDQGMLQDRLRLVLLASDTDDGRFLGQVLKHYYENRRNPFSFQEVSVEVMEGLTDANPKRFRREGLRNLVKAIAKQARKYCSENLVINATGGYKAQIAFAGMIGQALGIPVCYLFEGFSEVIELPPQPVALDFTFWLKHVDLFYRLAADGEEEDPVALDSRFSSLVDVEPVEGRLLVGLSAVGQLFHETFRHSFQRHEPPLQEAGKKPEEKDIKYEDGNPGRHPGLAASLKKLTKLPYVTRIQTFYYNPRLPKPNYFRKIPGEVSLVEGGYSDGKATTKFHLMTTAATERQRDWVLADLLERLDTKKLG